MKDKGLNTRKKKKEKKRNITETHIKTRDGLRNKVQTDRVNIDKDAHFLLFGHDGDYQSISFIEGRCDELLR